MTVFILTMWLYAHDTPLIIAAFHTRAECEAVRPQFDAGHSFSVCQSLTISGAGDANR